MEFKEMQLLWNEMSQKIDQQKILTDKLIVDITKERYTNRFNKILMYEITGALICLSSALFLILNFEKLDTWYLLTCGIVTLGLILLLPILVLQSIHKIKHLNIAKDNYKQTLIGFYKSKKQLLFSQRLGIALSFVLAVVILPVTSKILKNKDLFAEEHHVKLLISTAVLIIFIFFFSRWGYKGYKSVAKSAENILKELDS